MFIVANTKPVITIDLKEDERCVLIGLRIAHIKEEMYSFIKFNEISFIEKLRIRKILTRNYKIG